MFRYTNIVSIVTFINKCIYWICTQLTGLQKHNCIYNKGQ